MTPAETYKALCARCHGEKGDGNGKVAWYLDPSPRDLTKAAFMNSKPRDRFVNSIHGRRAGNVDAALGQGPRRRAAPNGSAQLRAHDLHQGAGQTN